MKIFRKKFGKYQPMVENSFETSLGSLGEVRYIQLDVQDKGQIYQIKLMEGEALKLMDYIHKHTCTIRIPGLNCGERRLGFLDFKPEFQNIPPDGTTK